MLAAESWTEGAVMFDLDPLLLVPFALVLLLMALPHLSRHFYGRQHLVTTQELVNRLQKAEKPAIIDLRRPKQFAYSHIPGAINLDRQALLSASKNRDSTAAKNLFDPTAALILVCESDLESRRTARELKWSGIENAEVLSGGMFKWRRDGLPVHPKKQTR